jgi:hypothetical protein
MENLRVLQQHELTMAQAESISAGINSYIATAGPEMLPKTGQEIMVQYQTGQSLVLEHEGNVVFHATGYENLSKEQVFALGYQVVELGSWIAMLRGQGVGTFGAVKLLERNREMFGENAIFLATHKRMNALNISKHELGFEEVLYEYFPYLAYLTCTCDNCSESFGFSSCPFRSKQIGNIPDAKGKIDCTLVISDIKKARDFENRCREESKRLGITVLEQGEVITTERMKIAKDLFDKIGI